MLILNKKVLVTAHPCDNSYSFIEIHSTDYKFSERMYINVISYFHIVQKRV